MPVSPVAPTAGPASGPMSRILQIRRKDVDAIIHHARQGEPDEVCGVLVGKAIPNGRSVEQIFPTRNAHPEPRRQYAIDPEELLRVVLHAEDDMKMEILGFYHSHPAGPPHLSATDVARATWTNGSYFLVWLAPSLSFGSWMWNERTKSFEAERVVVTEGADFLADTGAKVVHRVGMATPACGIERIAEAAKLEIEDEFKATMVLKTRHFQPCPNCWT
ncbi:MAG: M67 family metallopeptidase [Thermoplasmatota archaeon]